MSPEIPRDNDSAITFGSLFLQAARSEPKNIFMQYFPGVSSSSEWADFEIHRDKNLLLPHNTTKGLALLEKTGKRLFLYSEYFKIPASLEDHPLVYVITSPSSKNPWLVPQAEWTSVDGRTMSAAYIGERKINPGHLSSTKKIEWAYFWKNERLHSVPMKNLSEESRNKIRGTKERRNENTSNNLASN